MELEKKLNVENARTVEVERMRGALQVIKDKAQDEDFGVMKQMDATELEFLKEMKRAFNKKDELNQAFIVKKCKSKVELLEARKFLIKVCLSSHKKKYDIVIVYNQS